MTAILYAIYYDEHKQVTQATVTVNLHHSWIKLKHYRYVGTVFDSPKKIGRFDYFPSKESADEWLQRAARLVNFVNTSGLHPVQQPKKAHQDISVPDWSDHQTYWFDEFGNAFILIEPMEHAQAFLNVLDAKQFTWQLVPRPLSPYHAPERKDAFSMLLTTDGNKDRLATVIAQLELAVSQAGSSHECGN